MLRIGSPAGLGTALVLGNVALAYGSPTPFNGVAAADFDGDGDVDVAIVGGRDVPALAINHGSGFVVAPQSIPGGFNKPYAPPHDVDGDGDPDFIRAQAMGVVGLTTIRNDGRGVFGPPVPAGSYAGFPGRAVWGDLDNDGDDDLWVSALVAGANDSAVLNNGSGVFTLGATVASTGVPTAIALGDIDGDQDLDVIVGRGPVAGFPPVPMQPVLIRCATTTPALTYAAPVPFGTAENVTDIRWSTSNRTATSTCCSERGPARHRGRRASTSTTAPGSSSRCRFAGASARTVDAGDLNGDGLTDLVLGSQTWLRSATTFVQYSTFTTPIGLISLADLDLDGDLDLVDSAGRWYPADGLGAFGAPITIVSYAPYASIVAAPSRFPPIDMDSDGDLDFVGEDEQLRRASRSIAT